MSLFLKIHKNNGSIFKRYPNGHKYGVCVEISTSMSFNSVHCTHTPHSHIRFLFHQPIFPELLQVRVTPGQVGPQKSKLLEIVVGELLQAGRPSCHPTNSIKTLKNERVPDTRDAHIQPRTRTTRLGRTTRLVDGAFSS